MERRNALVEGISDLARPAPDRSGEMPGVAEDYLEVRFESGRSGLLDMREHRSTVWADVLRSLHEQNEPAYVEIDPETGEITELLLPIRLSVLRVEPVDDGLVLELSPSHGAHYLRRSHPDFGELRTLLEQAREPRAQVLVTETDHHEIVDVRALDEPTDSTQ